MRVWQIVLRLALWLVLTKAQLRIIRVLIGIGLIFRLVLIVGFVFRFVLWKALLSMRSDLIFNVLLGCIKQRIE